MTEHSPTEIAKALFRAMLDRNWDAAAALADPASLATWRTEQIAALAAEAEVIAHPPPVRAGGFLMSVEAEDAVVVERLRRHATMALPGLSTRTTVGDLVAMSPADFFAMYLQLTASLRSASGGNTGPKIIGHVVEDDTSAFVLYRWHGAGWPQEPQDTSLLRLQRGPDGWRFVVHLGFGSPAFAHALHLSR